MYKRVENLGYRLVITDEAKKFLANKGYDVQFGARPLKRAIQNYLENGLAEIIINEAPASGDVIRVEINAEKDGLIFINESKVQ